MLSPFLQKIVITALGGGFLTLSTLVLGDGVESKAALGVAALMFGWAWVPQPGSRKRKD